MPEVGGENPGAQVPRSDAIKPKEAANAQDIVVQSFLRASTLLSEFPAEKLTPQQLAAKDLMTWATRKTIDSGKRTFKNKFDSTDRLKVYVQEEGIPVDELISFLQERVQSGELDRKDTQTYKKLGRTLLQNSTSYYDAHKMGIRETLARVQREAARIRDDKRLATGNAKGDFLKAQSLLLQRRELIIPQKDEQPIPTTDTQNADTPPVIPPEATPPDTESSLAEPNKTTGEAWAPSLFDEPIETTWKNKDTDTPIKITGYMGKGPDGRDYFSIEEGTTGVPFDEIDAAPDLLDALRTKIPAAESVSPPTENITNINVNGNIEASTGRKAVWKNEGTDVPVVVTGSLGTDDDGQERFSAEGHPEGIPANQLEFEPEETELHKARRQGFSAEELEKYDELFLKEMKDLKSLTESERKELDEFHHRSDINALQFIKDKQAKGEKLTEEEQGTFNALNKPEVDDEEEESPASTEYSESAATTPLEAAMYEVLIDNGSLISRKGAALDASEFVRQELQKGSALNPFNWGRKVGLRILEPYWRQRIARQVVTLANEKDNPHATIDNATSSIRFLDLFRGQIKQLNIDIESSRASGIQAETTEVKKILEYGVRGSEKLGKAEDTPEEFRKAIMEEVIKPFVAREGMLTDSDRASLQKQIKDIVERNLGKGTVVDDFFGRNSTEYNVTADHFATNILETINMIRDERSAHKYGLEALDKAVKIRLANTRWGTQDEAHFNGVDRAIAAMQGTRLGILSNPAFVGAVTSIGVGGTMRAFGVGARAIDVIPGAGMFTGAIFAAIRRNYDLKVDMSMQRSQKTEGAKIPETGAKRRKKLEEFAYDTISINEWINGGPAKDGEDTRGLNQLINLDLTNPINRAALIQKVADGDARLDFSLNNKVDLFTFNSRLEISQGKLLIEESLANAKRKLREAGVTDDEINTAKGNRESKFATDIETQDKRFGKYRLGQAARAGVFGGLAGLASGLAVREALVAARDNLGIDINPVGLVKEGFGKIKDFKDLFQKGGTTQVGDYTISAGADHALSITNPKTGEAVTGWHVSENGHITAPNASADTLEQFKNAGFEVKDGGETTRTIFDAAGATEHQSIPGSDGAQHETLVPQGTKWVGDMQSGKYDLIDINNPDTKLVNDAAFGADGKLTYDQSTSLIKEMQLEGGTKQVFGPDGEWAKHAKTIDHREWYSYDQPNSQGNELGFDTYKNGDSVTFDMTRMGLGYQNGLNPNPIDVQQSIANHEVGFAISNPADPQNPIWVSDGADGVWDGKVTLSTTNANAEIYKMVINQDALSKLPDGNIATELNGRHDVFSIGSEGKMGTIEAGRLVPGQNGTALQTFATIRGSTPTPTVIGDAPIPEFTVPSPITEAVHVTELIPPSEREIPIIPIPFARRHPLEAVVAAPVTGIGYPEYSEYAEEKPTEYNEYGELVSKGEINHAPYTPFTSEEERSRAEKERTSETLTQERLSDQQRYLDTLQAKYTLTSPDPDVQKMLFRLNGSTKSYIDELTELNKSLPPMPEEARLTVIIPAYNEEGKIERTLQSWANQKDTDGNPIDPKSLDILILVNRPNQTKEFDNTSAVISNLKNNPAYTNLTINVVQKTFNFQDQDASITGPTGEQITIPRGVMMGLVYKVGADLAILRNQARQDALRKANHLMRTGGADVYSRNPKFVTRALDWFSSDPNLEQYVSRSDYPPKIYQKLPLLHVAQRLNEMMNVQFTNKGSNIGLGTYRMGIYASSGGFNTKMAVREEIDLSSRIRKAIRSKEAAGRKRETVINALDDPRRAIAATLKGIPITQIYSNWGNEDVRKVDIEKVLQEEVPLAAALTTENVQKQVDAVLKFYFRQILSSPAPTGLTSEQRAERAYKLTEQYMKRSLAVLGIDHYEIGRGTTISPDSLFIKVTDIDTLKELIEKYPGREKPAWIEEKEMPTTQAETAENPTPATDAEALQSAREELGTITAPTEAVIPTQADVLSPSDKWTVDAIEQGGTPILNALKIENILDGQECITPSGHKGKVIDHITLPDGSPALRIEITEGSLKGIWGTFDQEDLNNGKVATWTTSTTGPSTTTSA